MKDRQALTAAMEDEKVRRGGEAAEKLRAAAVLLAEAQGMLDDRAKTCECCGRVSFLDVVEARAVQALGDMAGRLRDWADTLYLPPAMRGEWRGNRNRKGGGR